jgi:hypothetical protein
MDIEKRKIKPSRHQGYQEKKRIKRGEGNKNLGPNDISATGHFLPPLWGREA